MRHRGIRAVAVDGERDVGNRRRDERAVLQQLIEGLVARLEHVLAAAVDERDERGLRDGEVLQRVGQRDGDGMVRRAGVACVELGLPLAEVLEGALARPLVRDVVRPTAVRVRRIHRAPFAPRQKAEADRKVRAMFVRDLTAVAVGVV